jgi:hypothetical protein
MLQKRAVLPNLAAIPPKRVFSAMLPKMAARAMLPNISRLNHKMYVQK